MLDGKRIDGFLKLNVTRYEHLICGKVETFITAMVGWVAEEDTRFGTICEFVNCGGRGDWIAKTAKHT